MLLNNGDLLLSKQSWKLQTELKGECSQSHQEDWLEQGKGSISSDRKASSPRPLYWLSLEDSKIHVPGRGNTDVSQARNSFPGNDGEFGDVHILHPLITRLF